MGDTSVSRPIRGLTSQSVLRSGTLLLNRCDPRLRPAVSTSRRSTCDKRPAGRNISRYDGGMAQADIWCHIVTSHFYLHTTPAFLMQGRPQGWIDRRTVDVVCRIILKDRL